MTGKQLTLLGGPFGGPAVGDPNWKNVALLSGTTSTNAGQNNTFLDSSSNNFTITRNGNTTQGTFSPFSQSNGYWGNFFDGSNDYLTVPQSNEFNFGTGDFTTECWVYRNTTGTGYETMLGFDVATSGLLFELYLGQLDYGVRGVANNPSGVTVPSFQWVHLAIARQSGTVRYFQDGVLIYTYTGTYATQNFSNATQAIISGYSIGNGLFNGYISNLRVVKGTAVYTSTFVPSTTPLTAISGTSLLTCQSNRILDNSSNAFTVSSFNGTAVVPFQPFNVPIVPYSTSTIGGSGYFDENGDYLDCGNGGTDYEFGSGDFTIEGWFYCLGKSQRHQMIMVKGSPTTNNAYDWRLYWGDTSNQRIWFDSNVFSVSSDTTTAEDLVLNAWNHIAVVRSGANGYLYLNGTRIDSVAAAGTMNNSYTNVYVGAGNVGSAGQTYYNGYANGIRLLKGTAQYTGSTYTVPTSPFTAITNTELLLNFTNANIYDQAAKNDMETAGNAQVSTSVKKYGDSSMAFDGNGDYLAMRNSPVFNLAAAEFTIEGWMYQTSSTGDQVICAKYEASFQASWYIGTSSTNWAVYVYYGSTSNLTIYTGAAPSLNTWNHFALVRCGDRILFYVNGFQLANVAAQTIRTTTSGVSIGRTGEGYTEYFNGYLSDIRITTGVGRYPYNFTPPTTSLPNFYQAQTLLADPYFDYTTLLLPGTGTNGAQNNTFLDSSSNTFSITRNGNTTQGTFSPFSQTGWSNYFEGTTNYLTTPSSSQFAMGDFTVECFINWGETPSIAPIFDIGGYISGLSFRAGPTTLFAYLFNASYSSNTISWTVNSWNHIALVRSGSTLYWYLNGTRVGTTSAVSTTLPTAQAAISGILAGGIVGLNRYVSNIRVVNTALYTGTTLTVPTSPLTAVSGTVLLTCQNNRFVDNSTNAFALTVNGTPSVQAFSPFNPTAAYSAATNGGSGYFDGSGDYLTITNNAAFEPNTYVSLECWVYFNSLSADRLIVGRQGMWINYSYTAIGTTSNKIGFGIYNGSTWYMASGTTTITTNQWYHVVGVRDSATLRIYINGVQEGTASFVGSPASYSTAFAIGASFDGTQPITGYLSGIRYCNGSTSGALPYTGSSFTVPTSPPTNTTDTKILANFTNAGITDATAKNDFETVGNAQISNGQAKWGSTSIYFDGSGGDAILTPMSPNLQLLGRDWTIEYWLYANSWTTGDIIGSWKSGDYSWIIQMNGSGVTMYNTLSTNYSFSATLSTGQWYHVALSNYNQRLKCFINGNQIGSTQTITAFPSATRPLYVGYNEDNGGGATGYNGYLQDVRITTGIARYTQNFTPPTAAFQLL